MKPLIKLVSHAVPLVRENIDTDAIIPSREMRSVSKSGLAEGLFAGWRYLEQDTRIPNPEFVLNQKQYSSAKFLISGNNFGCGSSREHAVWALVEYGFRAVIAPSFAPIFRANCIQNGIAPVVLNQETIDELAIQAKAGKDFLLDMRSMRLSVDEQEYEFSLECSAQTMLLEALDLIELTRKNMPEIEAFRREHRRNRPWLYL